MTQVQGKDYLYLIWKDAKTRRQYVVGQLTRNGGYSFCYGIEVNEAIEAGFNLMLPFDDVNKTYHSDYLFPAFSSRLPDKKRVGIEKILAKYNLTEYDAYELLKESGAGYPLTPMSLLIRTMWTIKFKKIYPLHFSKNPVQ